MTRQVTLSVNGTPINLDYFVAGFIDHTVGGMLGALKGAGQLGSLDLSLEQGQIDMKLNNTQVPVNEFVNNIMRNTITGMISTLKGVGAVNSLKLSIKR